MGTDELIRKYGEVEVLFESYYKYSFSFKSRDGEYEINVGGDSNDIYRFEVDTKPVKLKELIGFGYWFLATPDGDFSEV